MIDPFSRPPPEAIRFEAGDTVILCEGFDACAVVWKLCQDWTRSPRIGTCQDGANAADEIGNLAIQVRMHGIATIGLVFDAERKRATTVSRIKKWLKNAGLTPPEAPMELADSVLDGVEVRTAFLINPHGSGTGAIETYFLPQVQREKRWPCIQKLIACYKEHAPTTQLEDKVVLRTFIAHKCASNTGLNAAFNAKILSCDDKALDPVRQFVELLRSASPVEPEPPPERKRKAAK